jgi:hypothetical protein
MGKIKFFSKFTTKPISFVFVCAVRKIPQIVLIFFDIRLIWGRGGLGGAVQIWVGQSEKMMTHLLTTFAQARIVCVTQLKCRRTANG